jgi:hypothetical protein
VWCVGAIGGANGAEVGGVRSPTAREANGLGGDGHRRLTAALGGDGINERREGGGAGSRGKKPNGEIRKKKRKRKEKEKEEKWRERNEVQSSYLESQK